MGKRLRLKSTDLMETVVRLLREAELEDVNVSFFHRGKQAYELHVECEGSGWHLKGVFGSPEEAERMGKQYLKGGLSWPSSTGTDAAVRYKVLNLAGDLVSDGKIRPRGI